MRDNLNLRRDKPTPLNEPTYLKIKKAIISDLVGGVFQPGDHLTIDMLTTRYLVSHMPIREALRQLEGGGYSFSSRTVGFGLRRSRKNISATSTTSGSVSSPCLRAEPSSARRELTSLNSWQSMRLAAAN